MDSKLPREPYETQIDRTKYYNSSSNSSIEPPSCQAKQTRFLMFGTNNPPPRARPCHSNSKCSSSSSSNNNTVLQLCTCGGYQPQKTITRSSRRVMLLSHVARRQRVHTETAKYRQTITEPNALLRLFFAPICRSVCNTLVVVPGV